MAALAFLAKLSANLHDAWSKPNETSPPAPTAGFQCCPDRDVCPYPTLTAYTRCLHTMGAIQRCAGYGKDSAKEGSPTMATTKLSDEALLAFFQSRPELRDRMASIVGAVGNSEGNPVEADAAEERLVEEMRLLGREVMQSWASGRVEATEREVRLQAGMHRQGKKNSNGTRSSARSRS